MTLIDIDDGAAKARLREIAAANKAALDARMRQVAELDERARVAAEREEAELKAALGRRAEAEKNAAAAAPAEERPKRTLSLGAAEFAEERAARQAEAAQQPASPPPPAEPEPAKPNRTLRLGAPEDRMDEDRGSQAGDAAQGAKGQDKTAPRRTVDGDDDLSGRTWLR